MILTASRDKTVIMWSLTRDDVSPRFILVLSSAAGRRDWRDKAMDEGDRGRRGQGPADGRTGATDGSVSARSAPSLRTPALDCAPASVRRRRVRRTRVVHRVDPRVGARTSLSSPSRAPACAETRTSSSLITPCTITDSLSPLARSQASFGYPKRILHGHNGFVSDVVVSSDGQFALSASWDKTLRLWDLNTGLTTRRFVGHTSDVLSVSFSADNRQIVSGSRDRTIKLWNTLGECKFNITEDGHSEWVSCVRFSPNPMNPVIVSAGWDKVVKVRLSLSFYLCVCTCVCRVRGGARSIERVVVVVARPGSSSMMILYLYIFATSEELSPPMRTPIYPPRSLISTTPAATAHTH